jgi:hypothetical protein
MKIVEGQLYATKPELKLIRQARIAYMFQPELYLHDWLQAENDKLEEAARAQNIVPDLAFCKQACECFIANKYTEVEE